MCVPDFSIRGFSSSVRKREKSYVGEFNALTIWEGYRDCVFLTYSLGGRGFVGFNVNLILLGMLFFFYSRVLVFCAIVFVGSLSSLVYILFRRRVFIFFLTCSIVWHGCSVVFVGWKYDNIHVLAQILESVSLLSDNVWWWWLVLAAEDSSYTDVICLFWWESIDGWLYLTDDFLLWNFIRRYCKVRAFDERRDRDGGQGFVG